MNRRNTFIALGTLAVVFIALGNVFRGDGPFKGDKPVTSEFVTKEVSVREELSGWLVREGRKRLRAHDFSAAEVAVVLAGFMSEGEGTQGLRLAVDEARRRLIEKLSEEGRDAQLVGDKNRETVVNELAKRINL